jgi:hypothetical protein
MSRGADLQVIAEMQQILRIFWAAWFLVEFVARAISFHSPCPRIKDRQNFR